MTDLAPSLAASQPELLLGLAILAFLTVASFMGDRALRPISWAAVLTYAAAGAFMLDDPARQTAWGGLFVNDRFAQYLKALILLAAAASTLLVVLTLVLMLRIGE